MRGSSVVGAVLVVALLSAAAVMIDSSSVLTDAQLAQVSATTEKTATSPSAPTTSSGEINAKCLKGYDFAVYEEEGKASIACKASTMCVGYDASSLKPALTTLDANGKTVAANCDTSIPAKYAEKLSASLNDSSRRCGAVDAWECKVYHCSAAYKEGCKLMGTAKEGDAVGSKKIITKASTELSAEDFARLGEASGSSSFESISTGESLFSQSLLANTNSQAQIAESEYQQSQADLQGKLMTLQACQDSPTVVDPSFCQNEMAAVTVAQQKFDEKQRRLQEMQQYTGLLKEQQQGLMPRPQTGSDSLPSYCNEECQRALSQQPGTFPAGNPPSSQPDRNCGVLDFLCRNSGYPQSNQGGYTQGVYASPSQGAYPSGGQPGCNSNQGMGGGGIFGTIISLVMRGIGGNNNGGCNGSGSDAPTPSCTITATPRTVGKGDAVTLSWQSERGFSATLSSSGSVAPSGSMTVKPETTTTYTLQVGGYIDNRTGQQLRGQCTTQVIVDGEGGGTGAPKAEISCRPEVADVGMKVAVSFACANSSVSAGSGFSTNNQLSGSATPTIENPTIGTTNAIFGVTCSKEGKTDTAQCTVAINKTSIVLIANPKNVESGRQANIGWITSGMEKCTVSSPTLASFTTENAGNTAVSGVAKTPTLVEDTEFELTCTSKSGDTKTATTEVTVD